MSAGIIMEHFSDLPDPEETPSEESSLVPGDHRHCHLCRDLRG